MAEGKVGSLFVEFRASVDKFAADMRQMLNEIRSFDSTVSQTSKRVRDLGSDLGHLGGSTIINKLTSDLGGLASGIGTANTYLRQMSKELSDIGHLGSAAINKITGDLGNLTSGLNATNTFSRQASNEVSNFGHLGSAAIREISNDLGGLASGLNTANTFSRQAAEGVSDFGHLGSAAIREISNDLGGLASGLNTANTFSRQAAVGVSDLGHLGSSAINQVTKSTSLFSDNIRQISSDLRQFERTFYPIARVANQVGVGLSVGLTAPILAAGAFVLKTGIDFETAFAGVRKTVQASEAQLASLRTELIRLSTTVPVTAVEFANIAQAAGELGIKTPEIARFSQTVAELKATTRLTADEAANFLGRFTNITQLDPGKIHNLASTLVALGHGFAANESEIANFSLRIAGAGKVVGLTDAQILAFATTLASVGLSAESGGTAISRILKEIDKAVKGNETRLAQFASVARQSANDFAESFRTKPQEATLRFIEGLKRMEEENKNVYGTLEALKLQNIRVSDVLIRTALASGELERSFSVASDEFEKNAELTREVGERNKTTASQLKILKEQVDALGISLFDTLAPSIIGVIKSLQRLVDEGIKPVVDGFNKLPEGSQHFVEGMLLLAAGAGPAILAGTKLAEFLGSIGVILSRPLQLGGLTALGTTLKGIYEASKIAYGAEGLGGIIDILAKPIAVPWWLQAGVYGGLVIEIYNLERAFSDLVDAEEAAGRAKIGADNATFQAIENFRKRGINIPLPGVSTTPEQQRKIQNFRDLGIKIDDGSDAAMVKLNRQIQELNLLQQAAAKSGERMAQIQAEAAKAAGKHGAASQLTAEQLEVQRKATEALAKEHQKLLEKFTEELRPADTLNKELSYLQGYFSNDQIVAVYAKKIVDATEAQWAHGSAVSGTVDVLYEQAKALERVGELLKELPKEVPTIQMPVPGNLGGFPAEPGPQLPQVFNPIQLKALTDFSKAREELTKLSEAINNLSFLGVDAELQLFDGDLDKAAKFANAFKVSLPSSVLLLIAQKQAAENAAAGLKAWEDAAHSGLKTADEMAVQISATSANIQEMADAGFADAQILDILGSMIDKAAEAARILQVKLEPTVAMMAKMREEMKQNTKESTQFEREISRLTAKIVNDLANGIADALLSSQSIIKIAEKIGKDFAAAFVKAVIEGMVEPLVKKFEELGKRLAAQLAKAAAAHPVAAAIVATVVVAALVVKALGGSHLQANKFVEETQNPFNKSIDQFIKGAEKLYAAGRQTYAGAQEAETKVQEMWQGFLDDAAKFAKQGRQQATVAQQAIDTLSPTIRRIFFEIQDQIEKLKPPSIRAIEFVQGVEAYRNGIAALTDERIAELNAEASAINDQIQFTMAQIAAQDEMGGSTAELNKQLTELIYKWDAVQDALNPVIPQLFDFAEAVSAVSGKLVPDKTEQFLDNVFNATSGSANLEEALGILESVKTPVAIILDRLGSDVQDFANLLELSGLPIPPLIQKYLELAKAQEELKKTASKAAGEVPRIANSLSKLVGGAVDSLRNIAGGGDLAQGILDALARLLTGLPAPGTVTSTSPVKDAVDKLRGVAENIAETLKKIELDVAPISASADRAIVNPAFASVPSPVQTQVNITIEDNGQVTNVFTFTDAIGRAEVRGSVIPEITEALDNNTNSTREKWIKILGGAWNGVVAK